MDLMYDPNVNGSGHGQWYVVDVTLAWTLKASAIGGHWDCPIINLGDYTAHPQGYYGRDQWRVLLDYLTGGEK